MANKFNKKFWKNVDSETLEIIKDKTASFSLNLNKDKMRYFIFELVFNALKSEVGEINKPKMKIKFQDDKLSILNSISKEKLEEAIEIINEDKANNRQGLKRIKQVLKENSYGLHAEKNDKMIKINIFKESNNV